MIYKIINEIRRRRHELPKELKRHWLAGDYYYRNSDRSDREPKTDLEYKRYSSGDEVVLFEKENYDAVYEVDYVHIQHGDHAGWDDGRKYDFGFKRIDYK